MLSQVFDGPIGVEVVSATPTREVRDVRPKGNDVFLVLRVEVSNPSAEEFSLDPSNFELTLASDVAVEPAAATELQSNACSASITLLQGGTEQCTLVFEVPDESELGELRFRSPEGRTGSTGLAWPECEWCDEECADLSTNRENCGECGREVGSEQVCVDGKPGCADSALAACDSECVDLSSDPENCGACDIDVGDGAACEDGELVCLEDGLTACDGACISVEGDDDNCGECGRTCESIGMDDCYGGDGCILTEGVSSVSQSCSEYCARSNWDCLRVYFSYGSDRYTECQGVYVEGSCGERPPENEGLCDFEYMNCTCYGTFDD